MAEIKEVSIIQQEGKALFVKDAAVRQRLAEVEVVIDENNQILSQSKSNKRDFVYPNGSGTIYKLDDTMTIGGTKYNIYRLLATYPWSNFTIHNVTAFGGIEYSRVAVDSETGTGIAIETTYSDVFGASYISSNGDLVFTPANGIIDIEQFPNPKRIDITFYAIIGNN